MKPFPENIYPNPNFLSPPNSQYLPNYQIQYYKAKKIKRNFKNKENIEPLPKIIRYGQIASQQRSVMEITAYTKIPLNMCSKPIKNFKVESKNIITPPENEKKSERLAAKKPQIKRTSSTNILHKNHRTVMRKSTNNLYGLNKIHAETFDNFHTRNSCKILKYNDSNKNLLENKEKLKDENNCILKRSGATIWEPEVIPPKLKLIKTPKIRQSCSTISDARLLVSKISSSNLNQHSARTHGNVSKINENVYKEVVKKQIERQLSRKKIGITRDEKTQSMAEKKRKWFGKRGKFSEKRLREWHLKIQS